MVAYEVEHSCESSSAIAAVASGESVTYQWELVSGSVGFVGGTLESLVSTSYGVEHLKLSSKAL